MIHNTMREHVQGRVFFVKYFDGSLYYRTEFTNFEFPVPISDIGTATFLAEDKAMLFMRWIRKQMEVVAIARNV